jgi:hypothetical protein
MTLPKTEEFGNNWFCYTPSDNQIEPIDGGFRAELLCQNRETNENENYFLNYRFSPEGLENIRKKISEQLASR